MNAQIETIQKFGKDALEANAKSFSAVKAGTQEIATDALDYSKKAFAQSTARPCHGNADRRGESG
jgi:hypothetical protein